MSTIEKGQRLSNGNTLYELKQVVFATDYFFSLQTTLPLKFTKKLLDLYNRKKVFLPLIHLNFPLMTISDTFDDDTTAKVGIILSSLAPVSLVSILSFA